jgi:hypothetical protein
MNFDVMQEAIDIHERDGLAKAEEYLASSYDEETIKWGILRFNGHSEFRRRIRLVELAQDDYLVSADFLISLVQWTIVVSLAEF